ncbi:hypothetical protein PM082_015397 [Marasmius tenuissimus]|nr:hypothetical protein PM082_015397 [Marasmius tenuissimus]
MTFMICQLKNPKDKDRLDNSGYVGLNLKTAFNWIRTTMITATDQRGRQRRVVTSWCTGWRTHRPSLGGELEPVYLVHLGIQALPHAHAPKFYPKSSTTSPKSMPSSHHFLMQHSYNLPRHHDPHIRRWRGSEDGLQDETRGWVRTAGSADGNFDVGELR